MKYLIHLSIAAATLAAVSCGGKKTAGENNNTETPAEKPNPADTMLYKGETHFKNLRRITFKGDNAEAYWSWDSKSLVFQANNEDWGTKCDQIFIYNLADSNLKTMKPQMVSTGMGRTTCSYFMPGDSLIVYASTHEADKNCPEVPERKEGRYVWPIYSTYDIYIADLKGNIRRNITNRKGYDAEATVSPKGDKIVFTSDRSGDLELYTCDLDGGNVKQITHDLGYDGGAFFSPDGSKLVFRASRPKTPEDIKEYKDLLKQGLVEPGAMELFVVNVDGTDLRQVTNLGKANWCPFYHPDGKRIIFGSNHHAGEGRKGFKFNLFMINEDGTGLEQISFDDTFDAFPMFSPNGKYLVWESNRFNGDTHDTNIFIAEWKDK